MQYRGRLFTGRHIASGRHMQALPSTRRPSRHVTSGRHSAAVDKEAVTSRHVTSRHVRMSHGAAVDKEAVTSRHVRTSQAPPWTRMPSRHVMSGRRGVDTSGCQAVTSRHVTTSAPPEGTMLSQLSQPTFRTALSPSNSLPCIPPQIA